MSQKIKLTIPGKLLALDLLGVVLIGFGLYLKLTQSPGYLPLVLIVVGALMTLPLIIYIVKSAVKILVNLVV